MDKQRVYCFTGHRSIDEKEPPLLIFRLDETIAELVRQGVVFYGSGMALGWDTQAAFALHHIANVYLIA